MSLNTRLFRRGLMCAASLTGIAAGLGHANSVEAQVVERYTPPTKQAEVTPIAAPNAIPADQDATPIGPALRAIVVLGPQESVHKTAKDGIDVSGVARLDGDAANIQGALAPYLGKPLSRQLIAQIEGTIAERYRALNFPFVSLSTPAQEISDGVLQVRVVEFAAGAITTDGASAASNDMILGKISLKAGKPINARTLGYDISWLNRYPFRQVQAVFKPGKDNGTTDLVLQTFESRPWQVYGGYNNAGSPATGRDRYYVGGALGLKGDRVLAYQLTGSNDLTSSIPKFISHAFSYSAPVGYHRLFEASLSQVKSAQTLSPFAVRQNTVEGAMGLRFAVSDLYNDRTLTDMRFGVEAKRQSAKTYFGGSKVHDDAMEVYQLYLGYHRNAESLSSRSDLDVSFHLSPGNLTDGNRAAQVALFSQGRLKNAKYGYLSIAYDRSKALGQGFAWNTQIISLVTTRALPRTEQVGLGGQYLVRGYSLDDGAFDAAVVVRNELQMKASKGRDFTVRPYIFLDVGHGQDKFLKKDDTLASTGLGAHIRVAEHVTLTVDGAYALKRAAVTRSGDWKANASLNFNF